MRYLYLVATLTFLVFSAKVKAQAGCPGAANGNCSNAISLTVNGGAVAGTTCSGLESGELLDCAPAGIVQSVWYSFTATAANLAVTVNATSGCALSSAVWPASSGCPPTLGCQALSCQSHSNGPNPAIHSLSGLTIGTVYRIQVMYDPGGPCGSEGNFNISVSTSIPATATNPPPLSTCASPAGTACVFNHNPTVTEVTGSCSSFSNPTTANSMNEVVQSCFTFTGQYSTNVDFGNIISSNCSGGNVTWFDWKLYDNSCSQVACGNLDNMSTTGIVCGSTYKLCYTYEIPSCTHTSFYPFITAVPPVMTANTSIASICPGESSTLTANASGYVNYSWSPATGLNTTSGASVIASPTTTTTYTVTGYDAGGCSQTKTVTVTVKPAPTAAINPANGTLSCSVASIALTASGGGTYAWSTGTTGSAITVSTPNTYVVTVTGANLCTATASSVITQTTIPSAAAITPVSGVLGCTVTSIALTASGGGTYQWSTGATSSSINVTTPNTYRVTVTSVSGCTATASVSISQSFAPPAAAINPIAANLTCSVTSVPLIASGGVSYQWSNGSGTAITNATSPGTYTVTVTGASGCTATATASVGQDITPPTAAISPTSNILTCSVTSRALTATGGGTYSWSTGATSSVINVTTPNTYRITVTGANGCTATASAVITQSTATPNVSIAPPGALNCTLTSMTLSASSTTPGATFAWSGGGSGTTRTVNTAGTYSVTVTDPANGCTTSASVSVLQNITPPSAAVYVPSNLTCVVNSVNLLASSVTSGATYNWGGGNTTNTRTVTSSGTYIVTVTDPGNGCTVTASGVVVLNNTPPNISIAPPAQLGCTNSSVTLTVSSVTGGVTYLWSGGGTGTTKTVTAPGTYSVTATNPANGCTASASVAVIQNTTVPDVSIAPPATLTCGVTLITVTASSLVSGATYSWGGTIVTRTRSVTSPGTYAVTVTDPANNCTASASVSVSQDVMPPNASIAPPASLTCTTTSVTLIASSTTSGVGYSWSGGGTSATKTVSATGTYTVTVTDPSNACTATASASVVQNITPPNISIAAPATLNCIVTNVNLVASSTTAGTTYNWGGGNTTNNRAVSAPGTYSVTATDPANGCTAGASVTVTQNTTAPGVSIAAPAVISCTVSTVTLTASSGTGGVTYLWSGGGTGATKVVGAAGVYSVTVTNPANGCTAIASTTVTQSASVPDLSVAPPATLTCNVAQVTLTASSSVVGVNYSWGGTMTSPTRLVTTPGTYGVTVTDPSNGCSASLSVVVSRNIVAPDISLSSSGNLICLSNSSVLTASSTTAGVTYNWGGGGSGATKTVLTPGTYSVTATDVSNGCTASASVSVSQNTTAPGVSIATPAQITCTVSNVTLNASSINGVQYSWSNGGNTSSVMVNAPGNYSVTVTDPVNGCTSSATTSVSQSVTLPVVNITTPSVLTCSTTSVTLTAVVPGTVSYSWSGGGNQSTKSVSAPGPYSLTVTDVASGCSASTSVSVNQNLTSPGASIAPPLSLTCSRTNVTLTASSLIVGVTYLWSGGGIGSTKTISNPGNYTVTATDPNNGCSSSASVSVSQNNVAPNVGIATPQQLNCTNQSVTVSASSSSGATYSWSGGGTTADKIVTAPGNYTVSVSDTANGCTASASAAVTQNIVIPNVGIAAPAPLTCVVTSVSLNASSTTPGVTYSWSNGATGSTTTVSSPGSHSVTVTDPANGCTASSSVTVNQAVPLPNVSIATPNKLTCQVNSVILTASSTTNGVSFNWGSGNTSTTLAVNAPGNYSVTVTDPGNGCQAVATATVLEDMDAPDIAITAPSPLTCAQTSVMLTTTSSVTGLTYAWSGGGNASAKTVAASGNYSVTVTNPTNGCTASASVSVSQNITPPTVQIAPADTLTCILSSVILSASSTTAVTYQWTGGLASGTLTVTTPGTYSVTVTDPVNGCSSSASTNVVQNVPLPDVSIATSGELSCVIMDVTLTASSNTPNATFDWGQGNTTPMLAVITPGTYTVTVTNPADGCKASKSVTVNQNVVSPSVTIAPPADLTCTNNTVVLSASSSASSFNWNNGATTASNSVSASGVYSVTVTDASNGCTGSASVTVNQDATLPAVSIPPASSITCANTTSTLTASSPTPGVGFAWSGGGTSAATTVSTSGNYSVTVTDPVNGCSSSATVIVDEDITVPDVAIAPPADLTCTITSVNLTASSTTPSVNYDWGGGNNDAILSVSVAGTYAVTATNSVNGCTAAASANVVRISGITTSVTATDVLCNGGATGSVDLQVSGGQTPYVYQWSNLAVTEDISAVPAGSYSVTTTDNSGCSAVISVTISEPVAITISETHEDVKCHGAGDGIIDLTASGGVGSYSFNWDDGSTAQNRTQLTVGQHSVTVTDANQCTTSETVSIQEPTPVDVFETHANVLCNKDATGSIDILTRGGSQPYSYLWNDASSSEDRTQLAAGSYSLTVTDQNLCTASLSISITEPGALAISSAVKQPSCAEHGADGEIQLTPSGATPPYSIQWSNGGSALDNIHLSPGSYDVTITDANSCSRTESFSLAYQYEFSIEAFPVSTTIEQGKSVTLGYQINGAAGNIISQVWSPDNNLDCSDCPSPIASPVATTTYTIEVTNDAGCKATDEVLIQVLPGHDVFVPNVFTPNGDGVNDFFELFGNLSGLETLEIQLYNRWGELVFQSNDQHFKWDGTFRGQKLDPQVFVWNLRVAFRNFAGEPLRKGSLQLLK